MLTLYLAHPVLLGAIGQYLVAEDILRPADAIIVIGRDKQGERVERAVELFRQGLGRQLILSGQQIRWRTNSADIMKHHAAVLGVPQEAILIDRDGTTPTVQAEHVRELMAQAGLKSAILVTHSYHSARAIEAFQTVLAQAGMAVMSAPVATTSFDPRAWWTTRKGAKAVFEEYWQWAWGASEGE